VTQQLRAVLAGCGRISAVWLRAAREIADLAIVGLVDVRVEAAHARAGEFGLHRAVIGSDLETVLALTTPDIVFDCTVPAAHVPVRLAALRHGCHVLGEKPLADSMDGARQLIAAGHEAGKLIAVAQNRRYNASIRTLAALAASGDLGPLTTINSDHYMANRFEDFREQMRHPLLLDMAIHTFDAARCITGAEPVSVYCREWNPQGSWYAEGASAVALFEMTGNVIYTYRGSWCAEGVPTSPDCAWRLVGTVGSATWDSFETIAAQVVHESGGLRTTGRLQSTCQALSIPSDVPTAKTGGHAAIMREFARCVWTGEVPETNAADNIRSLAMAFGAIESATCGRPVAVNW
jgi:predicted dehydrogenase